MTSDRTIGPSNITSSSSQLRLLQRGAAKVGYSWLVISAALIPILMSNISAAESPNLIGSWKLDISFPNGEQRYVRFDAHTDGKGVLTVSDAKSKVWGNAKPSEAKWSRVEENTITFSGPVEFMLGNVGRDAGTLTFRGKFETADLITGDVEFSPLVGDGPSKHGTFKATRTDSGKQ